MKYKFNWFDLKLKSNYEPESILILTYALTKSYNSIIAWNSKHLMNSLKIGRIPSTLFKRKLLINSKKGIIGRYEADYPDAYFKNKRFLFLDIPLTYKIKYIYLLGHRKISNENDYLDVDSFKNEIIANLDNPLLKHEKNNVKFIYEGE
jgi:hypothetical protein